MLDPSFSIDTLLPLIKNNEYLKFGFPTHDYLKNELLKLVQKINSDHSVYEFNTFTLNGRKICTPKQFDCEISVRKLHQDICQITNVRPADRNKIVRELKEFLKEGVPYSILRLDIKKFFDSINPVDLRKIIDEYLKSTYTTRKQINKFLDWCNDQGFGVPAGISLSGVLSELYMKKFDLEIKRHESVRYYGRFVDDMIILLSSNVEISEFIKFVKGNLPQGLELNEKDDKYYSENLGRQNKNLWHADFDYLGYNFKIGKPQRSNDSNFLSRVVSIDISRKKIEKRKKKFIMSLKYYFKDGNADDLMARFLILNSGYKIFDKRNLTYKYAGMCNTYNEIDIPSSSLSELERFYRYILLSSKSPFAARLSLSPLGRSYRRRILGLNLNEHVKKKKHIHINNKNFFTLIECWKNA